MLDRHKARRNIMPPESLLELIPNNLNICREGDLVMIPSNTCESVQLMSSIWCLHTFSYPEQVKLLLYGVQPLISLKWFFCLSEDRRFGICEVLEATVLIQLGSLAGIAIITVGHLTHSLSQHALTFNNHLHKLSWCRRRRRRRRLFLIPIATTPTKVVRHLQNA
jgi:hypothetical protein